MRALGGALRAPDRALRHPGRTAPSACSASTRARCVQVSNGFDPELFHPREVDRAAHWRRHLVDEPQGWRPGEEAGSVAYGAADLEAFAGGPVLLYVGRFTAVKRVGLLIEAYARARTEFEHRAPLVLVGGYPGEWEGEHPADTIERTGARGRLPGRLARPRRAARLPQRLRRRRPALGARAVRPGAGRGDGLRAARDRGRRPRPRRRSSTTARRAGWSSPTICDGLAAALVDAVNRARGAPPARRARPRSGARALLLARAGRGGRRGLRGGPGRAVGTICTAVHIHAARTAATFPRSASGPPPAHREHAMHRRTARPTQPVGLYDPSYEHDACGVAMVARLSGDPCHETVQRAVVALENLEHRGAAGADPNTGDGAGMLLQLPDELLRGVIGDDLPPPGQLRRRGLLPAPGRRAPRRARGAADRAPSRPRASASSAGATCRSTRTTSASPPTTSRPTSSSSWWRPRRRTASRTRTPSSASST